VNKQLNKQLVLVILLAIASLLLIAASGDKPNRVHVNKFIVYAAGSAVPSATCTKGEIQLARRNLFACYTTNQWTFGHMSTAWPAH
jgi:hypothetical protein